MRFEYFIVLGAILIVPLLLSRDRNLRLFRRPFRFIFSIIIPSVVFWIWDLVAAERGHWWFNEHYITGLRILRLPIEEWLFFPIVAFVSIFTWESIRYFTRRRND